MTSQHDTLAPSSMPTALATYIETERRRADVAGTAVVGFDRNGLRFEGYFGYANLGTGERVSSETLFRAASISKLFTTSLVMQEIDGGTLALDEPMNRKLDARTQLRDAKGLPADHVTLRHLLTHTSGLPVSWKGLEYGSVLMKHIVNGIKLPETLEDVVAGQRTIREPGERIVYSNGGFNLLGHLVARLNRQPFEQLVRDRVLAPLAMHASTFPVDPHMAQLAVPYGRALGPGAGRKPAPSLRNLSGPAGALITTGPELARFGRMVLNGGELDGYRVLPSALLDDALRFHARNHRDLDDGYGLGFAVAEFRGRRRVGHDGGLGGVSTRVAMLPDDGVGVVVLTNGGDALYVSRVSERVLEAMLGLEPEPVPGSPAGIPETLAEAWRAHTRRVVGKYRMVDFAPPGVVTRLMGIIARPRVSHVSDGVLALDGTGFETAFLYPDGAPGRYRAAHPMMNGGRAIVEERQDGVHFWGSLLHLQK